MPEQKKKVKSNALHLFLKVNFEGNGALYKKLVDIIKSGGSADDLVPSLIKAKIFPTAAEVVKIYTFVYKTSAFDEIANVVEHFFQFCRFKPLAKSTKPSPPPPDWLS